MYQIKCTGAQNIQSQDCLDIREIKLPKNIKTYL